MSVCSIDFPVHPRSVYFRSIHCFNWLDKFLICFDSHEIMTVTFLEQHHQKQSWGLSLFCVRRNILDDRLIKFACVSPGFSKFHITFLRFIFLPQLDLMVIAPSFSQYSNFYSPAPAKISFTFTKYSLANSYLKTH